jgi:hypothetical protein
MSLPNNTYTTSEDFEDFLKAINGLKDGWYPDRVPITSRGFFEIDNGWLGIVKELIEDLIEIGWDKEILQVKEKFGGLRFYINKSSIEIQDRILKAEKISMVTCEICGDAGNNQIKNNWVVTCCNKHTANG